MKKTFGIIIALFMILSLFTACGAKSSHGESSSANDISVPESPQSAPSPESAGGMDEKALVTANPDIKSEFGLKVIYRATLEIEALDFDKSYASIISSVNELGGYVSNEYSYGGFKYDGNHYDSRHCELTIRVPSDKYSRFLTMGSTFGNVTSTSSSSEDITSQYIDTEARLNSLKAQEARILEMLDQATTIDDLIRLEEHLSNVRYQIESYTTELNTYENLVSFCTVTIRLGEVDNLSVNADTFGSRFGSAVIGSLRSVWAFLQNFVIIMVYALPYLILAVIVLLAVRKAIRIRKSKNTTKKSDTENKSDAKN
ncbi:MAG: DUF4349 domain-containing protein [Oscillospiraceae bacterium]